MKRTSKFIVVVLGALLVATLNLPAQTRDDHPPMPRPKPLMERFNLTPEPTLRATLDAAGAMRFVTTRKVYPGGTSAGGDETYTLTQLPDALSDALPGDTILLVGGQLYTGCFVLDDNDTTHITIKTGIDATGTLLNEALLFPGEDERVNPAIHAANMAKIQCPTNNGAAIRTIFPSESGAACAPTCRSDFYKIQFIEFIGNEFAGGSIVAFGTNELSGNLPGANSQNLASEAPDNLILDRVYIHGGTRGQIRGVLLASTNNTVENSWIDNIWSAGSDSQAILCLNTPGPVGTIRNNRLRAAGEVVMCGGDATRMNFTSTGITLSASTSTSATLTSALPDYMKVGMGISILCGGVKKPAILATIEPTLRRDITFANIGCTPDVPGMARGGVVPDGLSVLNNHMDRPPEWMDPIVATPAVPLTVVGSTTGGSLAAGNYCYSIVRRVKVDRDNIAQSAASGQACGTVTSGSTGSVTITWAGVADTWDWRVFARASGAQDRYFTATSLATSFTDTGGAGTLDTPPILNDTSLNCTSNGVCKQASYRVVKNIFELKNAVNVTVIGNIFEYSWKACASCGQSGTAILFTTVNQDGGNDSSLVALVTFRYNIIRHASGVFAITGNDATGNFSQRGHTFLIEHNLADDITSAWGSNARTFHLSTGHVPSRQLPRLVTIDHNTLNQSSGNAFILFSAGGTLTAGAESFVFKNNIVRRLDFGMFGSEPNSGEGNPTWDTYAVPFGNPVLQNNVIAGGNPAIYPGSGNLFPTTAQLESAFVDHPNGDLRVDQGCVAPSPTCYDNAATDGTDIGADIAAILAETTIAEAGVDPGDGGGGDPPPPPLSITTSTLPAATALEPYSATVTVTGGTAPYTLSAVTGLPHGVSMNAAGVLTGTPTEIRQATPIVVQASDSGAPQQVATKELPLPVTEPRPGRLFIGQGALFVQPTAPCLDDRARLGDLWTDTSEPTPVLKQLNSVSGTTCAWGPVVPTPGATAAFLEGGNAFGRVAKFGTTDNFDFNLVSNNTTRLKSEAAGSVTMQAIGTTDPELFVTTLDMSDFLSMGFDATNGRRIIGQAAGGTNRVAFGLADAAATTAAIFGVGRSLDGGASWQNIFRLNLDGTMRLGISGTTFTSYLSGTASLDFDLSGAGITCQDLTVTVTGATTGNSVAMGLPTALASTAGVTFDAWVSAADTVTVRACDVTSGNPNPAAATVRASVVKH